VGFILAAILPEVKDYVDVQVIHLQHQIFLVVVGGLLIAAVLAAKILVDALVWRGDRKKTNASMLEVVRLARQILGDKEESGTDRK
jgi:hypothetical protein